MQELNDQKNKRIFWLGMHKILVETELKRLRILGYEVFTPPYLSSIVDQSAVLDWEAPSDSTLPQEAISILAKTNFFYEAIPAAAAEILNQYFGTVIVTINPDWLKNILEVYHGKLIYRVYGQPYSLSKYFTNNYILDLITERENFWLCPSHEKALLVEDLWLKRLNIRIIPYCLPNDIIVLQDSWHRLENHNTMGLMCPHILSRDYYHHYYNQLKDYFSDRSIKIFGAQLVPIADPQVVGTLERKEFIKQFLELRGFIYHYLDPAICYLPPIEFMTLGGPVLFLKGSLLSKYFDKNILTPGEARNMAMLSIRAEQLMEGDNTLANEIIESQKKVRMLFHPSYVWPIFDKAILEIIESNIPAPAIKVIFKTQKKYSYQVNLDTEKFIFIPFHKFGANIKKDDELDYYSVEGILRVMNLMVSTLVKGGKSIIVTGYRHDLGKIYSFFAQNLADHSKLKMLIIENNNKLFERTKKLFFSVIIYLKTKLHEIKPLFYSPKIKNIITYFYVNFIKKITETPYIRAINKDSSISHAIIPHYYSFPEMQSVKKPIIIYLPDYMPHFYKGSVEMGDHWTGYHIGKKLTKKAKLILTNSKFTRNYLPNSKLKIKKEKIVSFPLAYLNTTHREDDNSSIEAFMKNLPRLFIFYPTRNRPSKRLEDFSEVVRIVNHRLQVNGEKRRIYGVLTTVFKPNVPNEYLLSLPTLSDKLLAAVYKQSIALLFTSENEGNFPTQINEAFHLGTPVIATDIPQITDELGKSGSALQLIEVGNSVKFADAVLYTMNNKELVLATQQKAREFAIKNFSYECFYTQFLAIFSKNLMELT